MAPSLTAYFSCNNIFQGRMLVKCDRCFAIWTLGFTVHSSLSKKMTEWYVLTDDGTGFWGLQWHRGSCFTNKRQTSRWKSKVCYIAIWLISYSDWTTCTFYWTCLLQWFSNCFCLTRLKCGEFLLLLIGHVNGRDKLPMATIHEDVRRFLGEKSASLIWAASQFGSTLDPEQRLTALHIQARRVLESIDLYWMNTGKFCFISINGPPCCPEATDRNSLLLPGLFLLE